MRIALTFALAALALGTLPATADDRPRTITLAYVADLHGQLESHPELFWSGDRDELTTAGGVARIATAIRQIRDERPGGVLFLDAGDTIQGSAAAAWTEGRAVIPAMNALGLDLALPGNWEVVYGKAAMLARAEESRHPWIAANVRDAATGERVFAPYLVREIDGVKVAVIGFTDPDVPERQPPTYSRGLRFEPADVLPALVEEVRSTERPDLVVLLTHVGLPKAVALAERLEGVDVILSGDTHERTYRPIVRGDTWVVEPGGFGSFLGRLDVTVAGGKVVDRRWELIELRADRFAEAPDVKAIVAETLAPLRDRLDRVVGASREPLVRYDVVETNLDAMLSDALREASGAEVALSNGFRFAAPTLAGPIRERDLWDWYPITTKLKTGRVTGRQIRAFWERELENVFAADPTKLFGGWVPRPSGLAIRFEAHAPKGRRVRSITVDGRPLDDDRLYTIVACEREGDAPDKVCRIPDVADANVLDLDAHEAVRRYLAKHNPLEAPAMGRVVADDLPPRVRSQVLGPARPDGGSNPSATPHHPEPRP
jgi:2',3'-cyclic-nucleotide 2'-phosphodiesterase (5'-nucleotidase family)